MERTDGDDGHHGMQLPMDSRGVIQDRQTSRKHSEKPFGSDEKHVMDGY